MSSIAKSSSNIQRGHSRRLDILFRASLSACTAVFGVRPPTVGPKDHIPAGNDDDAVQTINL